MGRRDTQRAFACVSVVLGAQVNVGNLSLGRPEDMQLWLQMLLKCADVANPGKRCAH